MRSRLKIHLLFGLFAIVGIQLPNGFSYADESPKIVKKISHDIRLQTLDERLKYAESLLERYPNILRANLQFRRNLLDVLDHAHQVSEQLGEHANEMSQHPVSSIELTYSPNSEISYHHDKIDEVKKTVQESFEKLPLEKITSLESDLAALKEKSLVEGVFHAGEYKSNLGRLMRSSAILYDADGKVLSYLKSGTPQTWKKMAAEHLNPLTGSELDNLFNDTFMLHQAPVIEKAAATAKAGQWTEVLNSQRNNFVKKTVAPAVKPIMLTHDGARSAAVTRYLKIEETLSPDGLFRGCFGKDCSILSVPYYPQVKDTKTYFVRKSKNPAQIPDGYAFAVPVEVEGKKIPYIITVNGNLTANDAKKVIQAIGVDWGTSHYVHADFSKTAYLVNTDEMRAGLIGKNSKRVQVKLPEGWSQVEQYIDSNRSAGYANYYSSSNLRDAFIAPIEPQGKDLLNPIQKATVNPPSRTVSGSITSRPILDRAILASEALEGNAPEHYRSEVLKRLDVTSAQAKVAGRLKESYASGIQSALYHDLKSELGFQFKNISELDLVTRAKSLISLHHQIPDIAEADQWKKSFDSTWGDIEKNWHLAEMPDKSKVSSFVFDEIFAKMPSEHLAPSAQFITDTYDWATSGGEKGSSAFYRLADHGYLSDDQIIKGVPQMLEKANDFKLPAANSKVKTVLMNFVTTTADADQKHQALTVLMKMDPVLKDEAVLEAVKTTAEKEVIETGTSPTLNYALKTGQGNGPAVHLLETLDQKYPKKHLRTLLLEQPKLGADGAAALIGHLDRFPESSYDQVSKTLLAVDSKMANPKTEAWIKTRSANELSELGKSPTLIEALNANRGDGASLKVLNELDQAYPNLRVKRLLLETSVLGKEGATESIKYMTQYPKEVTEQAVAVATTALTEKYAWLGRTDPLLPFHGLSEKILKEMPRDEQKKFIHQMLTAYGKADKEAWGNMYPQKYANQVKTWVEGWGKLSPEAFNELYDLLGKAAHPPYSSHWSYGYPRNLGEFMLNPDAQVREKAIQLKQHLSREVLPSAWADSKVPTSQLAEYMVNGKYSDLMNTVLRQTERDQLVYHYALRELFENTAIQDPKFFETLLHWYGSANASEKAVAEQIFHSIQHTDTLKSAESMFIRYAKESGDPKVISTVFSTLRTHHGSFNGIHYPPTDEFMDWARALSRDKSNPQLMSWTKIAYDDLLKANPEAAARMLKNTPRAERVLNQAQCFFDTVRSAFLKKRK